MKPYGIPPSPLYYEARREEEVSRRKTTAATQPTKRTVADMWAIQRAAEKRLPPPAPGEKLALAPRSFVLPKREIRTLDDAIDQAAKLTGDRASRATTNIAALMYATSQGRRETSSQNI